MSTTRQRVMNRRAPTLGDLLRQLEIQSGWHAEDDYDRIPFYAYREDEVIPTTARPPYPTSVGSVDTAVIYLNELKAQFNAHIQDTDVHAVDGVADLNGEADATDQATAITLANGLKADYNTHLTRATIHSPQDDNVNAVTAADATDAATLYTLTADLLVMFSRHVARGASRMAEEYRQNANQTLAEYSPALS